MRKERLISLIKLYKDNNKNNKKPDVRITALENFLSTDEIKQRRPQDEIDFSEFAAYLESNQEIELLIEILKQDYLFGKDKSASVFLKFKLSDTKNYLNRLPKDIFVSMVEYLPVNAVGALSQANSSLFTFFSDQKFWQNKLIQVGYKAELINDVIKLNLITDYKNLYRRCSNIYRYEFFRPGLVWQMLFISGEKKAIEYAIPYYKNKITGLYLAALSGSVEAIKLTISKLELKKTPVNSDYVNAVLRYAVMSGSIEAIEYVIKQLKADPLSTDDNGMNILHWAASMGHVQVMKYVVNTLKINPNKKDKNGMNALHHAAECGYVNAMKCAVELGVDPKSTDKNNRNALLLSSMSNVQCMKYSVETLEIDAKSIDGIQRNILHIAAAINNIEGMEYAIQLGIDPKKCNGIGMNAMHCGAMIGSVPVMRYAIEILKLDPNVLFGDKNLFKLVVSSGNVSAIDYVARVLKVNVDPIYIVSLAASDGNLEMLKYAIETLNIDPRCTNDNTKIEKTNALLYAIRHNKAECAKYLVQHGLDPNEDFIRETLKSNHEMREMLLTQWNLSTSTATVYKMQPR